MYLHLRITHNDNYYLLRMRRIDLALDAYRAYAPFCSGDSAGEWKECPSKFAQIRSRSCRGACTTTGCRDDFQLCEGLPDELYQLTAVVSPHEKNLKASYR